MSILFSVGLMMVTSSVTSMCILYRYKKLEHWMTVDYDKREISYRRRF
jgi:hypothetical protein